MKIDYTITITVVLAIVALIAPIITTLINNYHSYKIKELDVKQNVLSESNSHVKRRFEKFLSDYGRFTGAPTTINQGAMKSSFYRCLPYVPKGNLDIFLDFYNSVVKGNFDESRDKLENNLIPLISDIIDTL